MSVAIEPVTLTCKQTGLGLRGRVKNCFIIRPTHIESLCISVMCIDLQHHYFPCYHWLKWPSETWKGLSPLRITPSSAAFLDLIQESSFSILYDESESCCSFKSYIVAFKATMESICFVKSDDQKIYRNRSTRGKVTVQGPHYRKMSWLLLPFQFQR